MCLYQWEDAAAIELHWHPFVKWDLSGAVADGQATGARRIAIHVDVADYPSLPRAVLEMHRVAVVVSHSSSTVSVLSQGNPARRLLRICPSELAAHLSELSQPEKERYLDEHIFDFSSRLDDLATVAWDARAIVKVWDNVLSSAMVLAHPCFAYGCDAADCHLGRWLPPRRITIDSDGVVSPYHLDPSRFRLGSITSEPLTEILQDYYTTDSGKAYRFFAHSCIAATIANGLAVFSADAMFNMGGE